MSASALVKVSAAVIGITFGGYLLMKAITPDREKMMQMLPADAVTVKRMQENDERNRIFFENLKKNMNSNEPIWKMKEIGEDLMPKK